MKSYLSEVIRRKDLLIYLVKSGLKAEHRNSYLGYFWWLLDPLLNVLVYYFLVVVILQRDEENYPLFLVIGLVVWRLMSSSISSSSKSIIRYSSIINQVYIPKAIFPVAFVLSQLFNFLFGLAVAAMFLILYGVIPGWHLIYLPVIILITVIFMLALGLVLGYINVFVRDIDNVLTYVTRIFFYASPIIWPHGRLPEEYNWVVDFNPVAVIVTSYRDILMYHQNPNWMGLGIITLISLVVIIYMLIHYSKNEHKIIKAF